MQVEVVTGLYDLSVLHPAQSIPSVACLFMWLKKIVFLSKKVCFLFAFFAQRTVFQFISMIEVFITADLTLAFTPTESFNINMRSY